MHKIKETYLLFLIVIGLISLSLYSTYALFTASTEITDVVGFEATLSTNNGFLEYEMVSVPAGETKIVEVNITNSNTSTLYYGAWYQVLIGNSSDVSIGLYTDEDDTASSGQIASGASLSLLVGITNNGDSEIIVNLGTVASLTSSLGIEEPKILLPSGWSESLIVTDEVLAQYTTTEDVSLSYTTAEMTETTLQPGTYLLQAWGAQGGSYNSSYATGGKGGYSYGTLTLEEETDIFVYVGGQGTYYTTTTYTSHGGGGFNGGGNAGYRGGGGGGASDIRIGTDSLYARVLVAGGGGGAYSYSTGSYQANGGVGGGEEGTAGSYYPSGYSNYIGGAGTIETGGTGGSGTTTTNNYSGKSGTFGVGGDTGYKYNSITYYSNGAGGGGWYGGGSAGNISSTTRIAAGGGGGSGWIYTSDTERYTDSSYTGGTWLLDSSYYLTNAETIAGDQSFTDYSGSTVTGHSGNGAVKITGTKHSYSIPRVVGLDTIYILQGDNADLTSGVTAACATGKTGCSLGEVSITSTTSLTAGTHTIYYTVTDAEGKKYQYPREIKVGSVFYESNTSGSKTLSLTAGTYLLEVWGAQGGSYNTTYFGGKGGYSKGYLTLTSTTTIYAYAGGQGTSSGTSSTGTLAGGFNGGGNAYSNSSYYSSAGGGASDIRIGTDSLYARVIVAGGGSGSVSYSTSVRYSGAAGGGTSGLTGSQYSTSYPAGTGGNLTSGGNSYAGSSYTNSTTHGAIATFGSGGSANGQSSGVSGGGGGWYGGGYARRASGGGGSGWVYTAENEQYTASSYTGGTWLLNSSYYLTNAQTIDGASSFKDYNGSTVTGHSGAGAVRITKFD